MEDLRLGRTVILVSKFAVEDLPSAELQTWFLRLQWRTCPWAEHSDDDDDSYDDDDDDDYDDDDTEGCDDNDDYDEEDN